MIGLCCTSMRIVLITDKHSTIFEQAHDHTWTLYIKVIISNLSSYQGQNYT